MLHPFIGSESCEMPRRVFQRDRTMTFLRATVHSLPFTIAMTQMVVNWRSYYIGANIDDLSYLQFAAKLHEMAMQ